jgi:hypothetical protein
MTCLRHGSKFRINYYKLLIILNLNSECLILAVLMTFFLGVAGALGSIRDRGGGGGERERERGRIEDNLRGIQ